MTKKIKTYESATISINNGDGEIHIKEGLDGIFDIEIVEHIPNRLRLGFRGEHGIEFKFLSAYKD